MDKSCHVEPVESTVDFYELEAAHTAYFTVDGMGCQNCANRVKNSLLALHGIHMAAVYLHIEVVGVVYDPDTHTTASLQSAIAGAGNDGWHSYQADLIRVIESPSILNE